MNKTLAIFIEEEYLIAGIEPEKGNLQILSAKGFEKFPFYFNIKSKNDIDFSYNYKSEAGEGKANVIGNFIELVAAGKSVNTGDGQMKALELLNPVLEELKKSWLAKINAQNEPIPAVIAFSDNIPIQAKSSIKDHLNNSGFSVSDDSGNIAELITESFCRKSNIGATSKPFAVLDAMGNDLNIYTVRLVGGQKAQKEKFRSYPHMGTDPEIRIIAKQIVDNINSKEKIHSDEASIKKEYKRHMPKAEKIIEKVRAANNPNLKSLNIETTFFNNPEKKFSTKLSLTEVREKKKQQTQEYIKTFEETFCKFAGISPDGFERIFLVGKALSLPEIKSNFNKFGDKVVLIDQNAHAEILSSMLDSGLGEKQKSATPPPSFDKSSMPPKGQPIPKEGQKKRKGVIVPIIIIVAILVIVGLGFLFKDQIFGPKQDVEDDPAIVEVDTTAQDTVQEPEPEPEPEIENPYLEKADELFNNKNIARAKLYYDSAMSVEPGEGYIKDQLQIVNDILSNPEGLTMKQGPNQKYGWVDKNDYVIIDYKYDEAMEFGTARGGKTLAAVKKCDKWGFIKTDGSVAIDFQYDKVTQRFFNNGVAFVYINGKCKVILPDGSVKGRCP